MSGCDVLLVFADPVYYPAAQPYGLSIIEAALRERDISSRIVLPYFAEDPVREIAETCLSLRPKIIGFSFRNLDTAGFHPDEDSDSNFLGNLNFLIKASRSVDTVVALGGSGFSIAPVEIMAVTSADIGF